MCRSCRRSASGFSLSRDRSNCSYLLIVEESREQFPVAKIVRHDVIGAHTDQALPLPIIDRPAFGFRRGDTYGNPADQLHFLDFDVTVAEAQDLRTADVRIRDDSLNQDFFREAGQIVLGAVNAAIEIARNIEQAGFFLHVDLVGSAGRYIFRPRSFSDSSRARAPGTMYCSGDAWPFFSSSMRPQMRSHRRSRYIFL